MRRLVFGLAVLGAFLVVPAIQADDQAVGQRVVQTLQQQKTQGLLKDFSIDLQVENGVVWLKGEVASQAQRDMVLGAVRGLEGVTQVVNDLRLPEVKQDVPMQESSYDAFTDFVHIIEEKNLEKRYIARLDFCFDAERMRTAMQNAGLQWAELKSPPILLLPVWKDPDGASAWLKNNNWIAGWQDAVDHIKGLSAFED